MRSSDSQPVQESGGGAPIELAGRWRPGPPPVLLAARCRACGQVSFPPRPQCPQCWQQADTVPLPQQGTLYTFTTVYVSGPDEEPPRTLGYADFAGVRVLGPLTGAPPRIGAKVTVTMAVSGPAERPSRRYAFRVGGP